MCVCIRTRLAIAATCLRHLRPSQFIRTVFSFDCQVSHDMGKLANLGKREFNLLTFLMVRRNRSVQHSRFNDVFCQLVDILFLKQNGGFVV